MRLTGYVLIALALVIAAYTVITNMVVSMKVDEVAVGPQGSGTYWFAMVPAVGAFLIGIWLVYIGGRTYRETYDMRRQQT